MKTARAIEPNAGTRREYAKRVNRLVNQFLDLMTDEILLHVADAGDLVAQDWSLSKPTRKADREKLRRIRARVLAAWKRDPAAFAADIDDYVSRNIVRWTGYLDRSAEKLSQWVAHSIAADVTNAQNQAYLSAGISPEVFKDKWTIPVVRQHISPTAARLIPSIVEESVGNIERLALSKASRLQQVITEGLAQGHTVSKVKQTLRSFGGFDESTATSWAIDQTCRITQSILRANDAELGVTKGVCPVSTPPARRTVRCTARRSTSMSASTTRTWARTSFPENSGSAGASIALFCPSTFNDHDFFGF